MSFDQRVQAEALVQLTRQQQPGVGGHRRAVELDAKLGLERQANWARSRHPLGGALRANEEPPRATFLAGRTRLWSDSFTFQNENAG